MYRYEKVLKGCCIDLAFSENVYLCAAIKELNKDEVPYTFVVVSIPAATCR
jgi:hypothetical protein